MADEQADLACEYIGRFEELCDAVRRIAAAHREGDASDLAAAILAAEEHIQVPR